MLMDFCPHCTETEVWADGDHGAHPINTLPFLPFLQDRFAPMAAQWSKSMTERTRWRRGGP